MDVISRNDSFGNSIVPSRQTGQHALPVITSYNIRVYSYVLIPLHLSISLTLADLCICSHYMDANDVEPLAVGRWVTTLLQMGVGADLDVLTICTGCTARTSCTFKFLWRAARASSLASSLFDHAVFLLSAVSPSRGASRIPETGGYKQTT